MKKLIVCVGSIAVAAGLLLAPRVGVTQDAKAAAAPHQVGLIDMAHVFKEYSKFKALSDSLKAEVEASDRQAKAMVDELQKLQAQLTSGTLSEDSPEFSELKKTFISKQADLDTFRKSKQREFLRKEADIYKTVYLEVQDAVHKYARYYNYTLIMRFNRDRIENAEDPQAIIASMNRPVVFHRTEDDLTDPILKHLNDQYNRTAARPATPAGPRAQ